MYKTSKDYEKLWEIYKSGQSFHRFGYLSQYGEDSRNSCIIYPTDGCLSIVTWSDKVIRCFDKKDWMRACKQYNLDFIDPDPPKKFCKTCRWWGDNDSNEVYKHSPEDGKADCHCENLPMRNFATKTSPDFGCIFHEESEER